MNAEPQAKQDKDKTLTVYYNAACPVCKAGIDGQRETMDRRGCSHDVAWQDIAENPGSLSPHGLDLDTVRHSLHVFDGEDMHVGADAFIVLANATPGQGWLAKLFGHRYVLPLTRWVYTKFADVLFKWNQRNGRW